MKVGGQYLSPVPVAIKVFLFKEDIERSVSIGVIELKNSPPIRVPFSRAFFRQ